MLRTCNPQWRAYVQRLHLAARQDRAPSARARLAAYHQRGRANVRYVLRYGTYAAPRA